MLNNSQTVNVYGGRSVVQFAKVGQQTESILDAFSPENCTDILTTVKEHINGWKIVTHTFEAKDKDYVERLLQPFIANQYPDAPRLMFRFGLVSADIEQWRPWEKHVLISARVRNRPDSKSAPLVTITTVDLLWIFESRRRIVAHSGCASSIVESLWSSIGGSNSVIEPTFLSGHTESTGIWYQAADSDWSFIRSKILPMAVNKDGASGYRIYVKDDVLRFHTAGYLHDKVAKKVLYSAGQAGFTELAIDDRSTQLIGEESSFGRIVSSYDPLLGQGVELASDNKKFVKFAESRSGYENYDVAYSHIGDNLVSVEEARNQHVASIYSSEQFKATITVSKCLLDLRIGDIVNLVFAQAVDEATVHSGLWSINAVVHTMQSGDLRSKFIAVRGDFNMPLGSTVITADQAEFTAASPGLDVLRGANDQDQNVVESTYNRDGIVAPVMEEN